MLAKMFGPTGALLLDLRGYWGRSVPCQNSEKQISFFARQERDNGRDGEPALNQPG